jgi:hypothetical protein
MDGLFGTAFVILIFSRKKRFERITVKTGENDMSQPAAEAIAKIRLQSQTE